MKLLISLLLALTIGASLKAQAFTPSDNATTTEKNKVAHKGKHAPKSNKKAVHHVSKASRQVNLKKKASSPIIQASQKSASKSKLSTNLSFDDQVVGGKYQYPDEAVTTVEDDKGLNDLLEPRQNFKDRLKTSQSAR